MFKVKKFNILRKYEVLLSWSVNMSQKTWAKEKPGKVSGTSMKQLEEHFATNWVGWQQVSNKKMQHFSEGKLGHQSAKNYIYQLWKKFKIRLLNIKLWMFWISHHQQWMIPSKDSETLKKSLCAWDKAKHQYWKPLIFGQATGTKGMFLSWKLMQRLSNTSRSLCL